MSAASPPPAARRSRAIRNSRVARVRRLTSVTSPAPSVITTSLGSAVTATTALAPPRYRPRTAPAGRHDRVRDQRRSPGTGSSRPDVEHHHLVADPARRRTRRRRTSSGEQVAEHRDHLAVAATAGGAASRPPGRMMCVSSRPNPPAHAQPNSLVLLNAAGPATAGPRQGSAGSRIGRGGVGHVVPSARHPARRRPAGQRRVNAQPVWFRLRRYASALADCCILIT
jgi:hypothetical protein